MKLHAFILHGVNDKNSLTIAYNELKWFQMFYCTGFHKYFIYSIHFILQQCSFFLICLSSLLQNSSTSMKTDKIINTVKE